MIFMESEEREVNGMLFHSSSLQMIKNQKSFEDFTVSLFRSKDCSLNIAFSGKRKPEWGEAQDAVCILNFVVNSEYHASGSFIHSKEYQNKFEVSDSDISSFRLKTNVRVIDLKGNLDYTVPLSQPETEHLLFKTYGVDLDLKEYTETQLREVYGPSKQWNVYSGSTYIKR